MHLSEGWGEIFPLAILFTMSEMEIFCQPREGSHCLTQQPPWKLAQIFVAKCCLGPWDSQSSCIMLQLTGVALTRFCPACLLRQHVGQPLRRWTSSVGHRPTELRTQGANWLGCSLRPDAILQGLGPRAFGGSTLRFTDLIEPIGEKIMGLEVIGLQARRLL